jgi:hypothetical protein
LIDKYCECFIVPLISNPLYCTYTKCLKWLFVPQQLYIEQECLRFQTIVFPPVGQSGLTKQNSYTTENKVENVKKKTRRSVAGLLIISAFFVTYNTTKNQLVWLFVQSRW